MFGFKLIFALAVMGGIIAFIGDKLGYKLGKKRLSVFGLRPKNTSTLMAVASGVLVASITLIMLSFASSDVRTALFGMDKLRTQMQSMSSEVANKNQELADLQKQLEASSSRVQEADRERDKANMLLADIEVEQKKAYADLARYQLESAELQKIRDNLQAEVNSLEKETEALKEGIINMREGQVAFRAGQVIYAGVLTAGQSYQETTKALSDFLNAANNNISRVLGIKEPNAQLLFVPQDNLGDTVNYFLQNKGSIAVRLQAAGNILVGEPVVAEFRLYPNKLVYKAQKEIYSETIPATIDKRAAQAILINFLAKLNSKVVAEGILPDPVTGNVGDMDLPYMMEVMEKIRATNGEFTMTAVASQDIYTLGPLRVNIIIKGKM